MHTDDTHLSSSLMKPYEIRFEIIIAFSQICDSLQANKLSLNIFKTECMIIGTEKSLIQLKRIIAKNLMTQVDDLCLKRVNKTRSLNLIMDDNLQWSDHIDYLCSEIKDMLE